MLFDFNKKNTLIIIPARGGSKRVRNKKIFALTIDIGIAVRKIIAIPQKYVLPDRM